MILSIVIPVYNASNTIKRCLDSVWNAKLPEDEYEVVCVDDCSPDNSIEVIEGIQKTHSNLRILKNHENLRAGGARNHGVRKAHGEYIVFIDSDDYFESSTLHNAFIAISETLPKLDILYCDSSREIEGRPSLSPIHGIKDLTIQTGESFLVRNGLPLSSCKYLFRKDLMLENNIFFTEKMTAEDGDWALRLSLMAKRMQFFPQILFHYVLMPDSVTASVSFSSARDVLYEVKRMDDIAASVEDREVREKIIMIRNAQTRDAINRYLKCWHNVKEKGVTLKKCIVNDKGYNGYVKFAVTHPFFFSFLSNLTMPAVICVLRIKRSIKGRL